MIEKNRTLWPQSLTVGSREKKAAFDANYVWGGSIMLWDCVASSETVNTAGVYVRIRLDIDSTKYISFLEENVTRLVKKLKLKTERLLQKDKPYLNIYHELL